MDTCYLEQIHMLHLELFRRRASCGHDGQFHVATVFCRERGYSRPFGWSASFKPFDKRDNLALLFSFPYYYLVKHEGENRFDHIVCQ